MDVCDFFFFFKQKTAYDMRISDWSSDVCSSDLGVAVVPVGTALPHLEPVMPRLAKADTIETQARHAIHVGRQQDAVPVDRGVPTVNRAGRQGIGDVQIDGIALAPAQGRRRHGAVDGRSEEHTSELPSLMRNTY